MLLYRAHRLLAAAAMGFALTLVVLMAFDSPSDAGSLPPGGTFIDDDLNVHEGYIEAIAEIGVTLGCTQDEYCPHMLLSRAQMASLIAKALDLGPTSTDYFNDDNGSVHEQNITGWPRRGSPSAAGETTTALATP